MQKINRHRIRKEDIQKSVHNTKKQTMVNNPTIESDRNVRVFTLHGDHEYYDVVDDTNPLSFPALNDIEFDNGSILYAENRDEALAKTVQYTDQKVVYYTKQGMDTRLYDPLGMFSERHKRKGMGKQTYFKYIKVNKKTFMAYVNYLRTKNRAYLLEAERER